MQRNLRKAAEIEVIAPNLKFRYSGITSTITALLPVQAKDLRIASLGPKLPPDWPQITLWDLFRHGRTPPPGRSCRIWHARRNFEMLAGVLLRLWCGRALRLVFTSAAQRDHTRWTKFLISRMDALLAASPECGSYLRHPFTVNMHGVDTSLYHPVADREAAWRETGLPGKFGIGIFGRVRSQKGTDRFVDLMCRLLPKHPDFTAVIVGAVTPEEAAFEADLKSRVAKAGLAERVRFLGLLPSDEVRAWLRRVLINVSPQRWEGFGLLPIEAGASGTTSVATRVGAAMHLIEDGHTGYLVDKDDLSLLERRLDSLMADPTQAAAMGQTAREHVLAKFSIAREAAGIRECYERLWHA
jgi:mannosyltransferase